MLGESPISLISPTKNALQVGGSGRPIEKHGCPLPFFPAGAGGVWDITDVETWPGHKTPRKSGRTALGSTPSLTRAFASPYAFSASRRLPNIPETCCFLSVPRYATLNWVAFAAANDTRRGPQQLSNWFFSAAPTGPQ